MDKTSEDLMETTINQLAWKPVMRAICCQIVKTAIEREKFWPDEINFDDVPDQDKNCIGTAFKLLSRYGIIEHGTEFRRSTAKRAASRTIFTYLLNSRRLACTFLQRNGVDPFGVKRQGEMCLA